MELIACLQKHIAKMILPPKHVAISVLDDSFTVDINVGTLLDINDTTYMLTLACDINHAAVGAGFASEEPFALGVVDGDIVLSLKFYKRQ